jgi:hypothetical protein
MPIQRSRVQTYGPTDLQTYGPTDQRTFAPKDLLTYVSTDLRTNGPLHLRIYGPTDLRIYGPTDLQWILDVIRCLGKLCVFASWSLGRHRRQRREDVFQVRHKKTALC